MSETMYNCSNCKWQGELGDLAACEVNKALLCPECLNTIIYDKSPKAIRQALVYIAGVGGQKAREFMKRNNL